MLASGPRELLPALQQLGVPQSSQPGNQRLGHLPVPWPLATPSRNLLQRACVGAGQAGAGAQKGQDTLPAVEVLPETCEEPEGSATDHERTACQ